jgi:hypothetical protein
MIVTRCTRSCCWQAGFYVRCSRRALRCGISCLWFQYLPTARTVFKQPNHNYIGVSRRFKVSLNVMKTVVFWDVMPSGSYKDQSFTGGYRLRHRDDKNWRARINVRSVIWLLVTANVPSRPILVSLMTEAIHSSETSILIKAKCHLISEDDILHTQRRENLKSHSMRCVTVA